MPSIADRLRCQPALVLIPLLLSFGCTSTLLVHLNTHEELSYKATCAKAAVSHTNDLANGRYFLPEFHVEKWRGTMPSGKKITEKELIAQLLKPKTKLAMVTGRGGLGKTRLAKSIEAQTCKTTPIFKLDLNKDVAAHDVQGNDAMLLMMLAKQLRIGGGQEGLNELDRLLRSQPWIVLADAIEEVDLLKRAKVALSLTKLRLRYPNTLKVVVFARPPLLVPHYGFSLVDIAVQILPITCDRAQKFVGKLSKGQAEEARFWAFAKDYGFDVQNKFGFACQYPYMATYRDVIVLRKLALGAGKGVLIESYADAHEHMVGERMRKELGKLGWSRREALDMIDRMVRFHAEKSGPTKLRIGIEQCMKSIDPDYGWTAVDAGVDGNSEQRRRQVCEKTLQSVLFKQATTKVGDSGAWQFSDPISEELFQARWMNGELARAPDGDCTSIDRHRDLLKSGAVIRFLVGQRMVQRCFPQTIRALCGTKSDKAAHLQEIIAGLPRGTKRQLLIEEARAWEAEKGNDKCAMATLDVLNSTVVP
jgi:hypothetical protein